VVGGYLVTHENPSTGALESMFTERVNLTQVDPPPNPPWAAYFTGTAPFGTVDGAATMTDASGSALVVPALGQFTLGGQRPGKTCKDIPDTMDHPGDPMLQPVANAIIHVALSC
jgi:hypothetical protein